MPETEDLVERVIAALAAARDRRPDLEIAIHFDGCDSDIRTELVADWEPYRRYLPTSDLSAEVKLRSRSDSGEFLHSYQTCIGHVGQIALQLIEIFEGIEPLDSAEKR